MNMKIFAYLSFAYLILAVQSQAQAASEIHGHVLDQDSKPIHGARISFAGSNQQTCTDERGKYSLASRSKYFYTVRAVKSKYDEKQHVIVGADQKREASFILNKNPSKTFADCHVRTIKASEPYWQGDDDQPPSRPSGAIGGLILDSESGQLLPGVTITTTPITATTTTDSQGAYTIYNNVAPGLYEVFVRRPDYKPKKIVIRVQPPSNQGTVFVKADAVLEAYPRGAEGSSNWQDESPRRGAEGGSNIEDFEADEEQADGAEGRSRYDNE